MRIIDEHRLKQAQLSWRALIDNIELGVHCLHRGDYVQPLKPYVRVNNKHNRIIAMPAYVGSPFHVSGIKWISSFPDNVQHGLPRAHSVVILNDADTGAPTTLILTPTISIMRTAAVSGLMLKHYIKYRRAPSYNVGIIGWGPIGKAHMNMCKELLGHSLGSVYVYDKRLQTREDEQDGHVHFTADWREVYHKSDIFITCTSSTPRYIDEAPQSGKLLLHVSLRDYEPHALRDVDQIVVDDWQEICREDTDIERLHLQYGLKESDCMVFSTFLCEHQFAQFDLERPILFSPMGMAVFDLCTAVLYDRQLK